MLLELDHVTKTYGRVAALRDVSFRVSAGEVVGLAGKNGAGKTTVIRLLMGFLECQAGRLSVLGSDPRARRHLGQVGWMPEHPAWRVAELIRFQQATFQNWYQELAAELVERLEIDPQALAQSLSRG